MVVVVGHTTLDHHAAGALGDSELLLVGEGYNRRRMAVSRQTDRTGLQVFPGKARLPGSKE